MSHVDFHMKESSPAPLTAVGQDHGRMNYKDTKPYMSAFLSVDHVNRLCRILFKRFYRPEIHSLMVCIIDPTCELLPPWTKELYLSTVAPLLYFLSDLLPPFPMYSVCRQCATVGVGGMLKCTVDHILQEFYTLLLTRFRTLQNCFTIPNKITSKDDIKGLVSLKFLRPWTGLRA